MIESPARRGLLLSLAALVPASCLAAGGPAAQAVERAPAEVFRRFEGEIPRLMRDQRVPGIAVAVADEQGTVWCRGFGETGGESSRAVDGDTIFSIQSASKTFTALGVMLAVQEGLVGLDEPITTYLPDFRVNSVFEARPEVRMTLRHLLSHTAGFTHEAPVGNNFDLTDASFEDHVRSISSTWLRFPVGENYAYSNLGFDLAAFIIARRAGMPFERFLENRLFGPLDMGRSTLDVDRILRDPNQAIGHDAYFRAVPVRVPMLGAGGAYASARDLAEFLRFILDHGRRGDRQVLDGALLETLFRIPPFAGGRTGGYALGVVHFPREGPRCLGHSGGGFGFLSDIYWYPDVGIGAVVLTNSTQHSLQQDLIFRILDGLVQDGRTLYHSRLSSLPPGLAKASIPGDRPGKDLTDGNEKRLAALATSGGTEAGAGYAGNYRVRVWGRAVSTVRIRFSNGVLALDGEKLYPAGPGLFMTAGGEALDVRAQPPTWRNIPLERISVPFWQWGLLGLSLLLLVGGLLAWSIRAVRDRWRSAGTPAGPMPRGSVGRAIAMGVAVVNALLCLSLLGVLSGYPAFVGAGMPDVTPQTPGFDSVFLRLPIAVALLTCLMAAYALAGLLVRSKPASFGPRYAVITTGAIAFVALLVAWKVIGI